MIWESCNGSEQIKSLTGETYRIVENQEQIATSTYVDNLAEQAVLEELLETVKPDYPEGSEEYDFLLKTPFRYPPLKWGSRFGKTSEPSLFYAANTVQTTLAEAAYYRFLFWNSMLAEPIKDSLKTQHTLFSVNYKTKKGLQLQATAFQQFTEVLTHPKDYSQSQQLGTEMRSFGIEAFEYLSTRDPQGGICTALFTIKALSSKALLTKETVICEVRADSVSFFQPSTGELTEFSLDDFLYKGELPLPA